jgi:glycosyltransferase involved in cell wall biosynthesis
MPKFVIVIPSHDSFSTLRHAVESAITQKFDDYSIVISDNASQDGTVEYLNSLKHFRVESAVSHKIRVGKSENWNRAFALASDCQYLVMLHSDDVLYADSLVKLSEGIARFGCRSLFFSGHDQMALPGEIRSRKIWPVPYMLNAGRAAQLLTLKNTASVVGFSFRPEDFSRLGGFDPKLDFLQDQKFAIELAGEAGATYLPVKMGCYRDSPVRPSVIAKWAPEELRFIQRSLEQAQVNRFLANICLRGRMAFLKQRIEAENPNYWTSFHVELLRIGVENLGESDRRKLLWVSRILKAYISAKGK